jgi:hypothetical protein
MRNIFIVLIFSIGCLLAGSSVESNAQTRSVFSPTSGHCPQGTKPKSTFGSPGNAVPNPATDCVPDGKGGGSSAQKEQKK